MTLSISTSLLKGPPVQLDSATIPEIVAKFAAVEGDSPAVQQLSDDGTNVERTLSRSELNSLADTIATNLLAQGLQPDTPVLLCANRSLEVIAAMVGVLRAGGIFVPIDPDYPGNRIEQMIQVLSTRPLALVDQKGRAALLNRGLRLIQIENVVLAAEQRSARFPYRTIDDPAYIMFTSGSTGVPKGVTISHRAIKRLAAGNFATQDRRMTTLQLAPIAFDASTLEIWGPLLNGGRCVLYPGGSAPDLDTIESALSHQGITTLWLTASLFNLITDIRVEILRPVTELFIGGEVLSPSHVAKAMAALPNTRIINGYGPTENTTFTCCYRIPKTFDLSDPAGIPLGTPIAGTDIRICDDQGNILPWGEVGELVAGGEGVALGYWKRDDLTVEKFFSEENDTSGFYRYYKTGDRAYIDERGLVRFVGRNDDQIKLDGHRIELGEVTEALRQIPEVRDAYTIVREDQSNLRKIVSYVVSEKEIDSAALRKRLELDLPAASVPSHIMVLDALPLSPVGKIDRDALPPPVTISITDTLESHSKLEHRIQALWCEILALPTIGRNDDFFQLGGNSICALRFIEIWKSRGNPELSIAQMYGGATPARLANVIAGKSNQVSHASIQTNNSKPIASEKIAIVGMAGRFPGADSVDELWQMLLDGVEGMRFFSLDEMDPTARQAAAEEQTYVAARGIVAGIEEFDCERFGLNTQEAALLDPQQRLLLETAWDTLESAGCDPAQFHGPIGVWAGTRSTDYLQKIIDTRPEVVNRMGLFQISLANDKDFVANRIAYLLGLTGPAISVHTACSTSLVAVHEAARGLANHECDLALAGGAAVTVPQIVGHVHQEGDILSADGHCRPFDVTASGTLFNDGVAMVALKRLEDAQRDGDNIHAVILGSAVNNDGGNKASFMAPSPQGQSKVVAEAINRSGVSVDSIGFVETHGTATPLGDPVEVEGLLRAFGHADRITCVLGSIKSNIGHLTAAAGVAGLIKATLAVRENVIPPTLHFKQPNPLVDFGGRFTVSEQAQSFMADGPRRAGVSSLGVGGTNAHVVIEQPPEPSDKFNHQTPALIRTPILYLSAPVNEALGPLQTKLADCLLSNPDYAIEDVSRSLRIGRHQWPSRCAIAGATREEVISRLQQTSRSSNAICGPARTEENSAILVFPGQSSQYAGMATGLAESEPVFARHFQDCAEELGVFGDDLTLPALLKSNLPEEILRATRHTQPALFAVEYALAKSWIELGLQPDRMLGHSLGEFVAACLAGVFTLGDALALVAARGEIMDRMPRGEMLSVRIREESLDLPGDLDLAAVNGESLCVIAGTSDAIASYSAELDAQEIPNQRLATSHAFHSHLMMPAVAEFRSVVESTNKNGNISIPIQSTTTGKLLTSAQATSDQYWSNHLRVPVRFADAITQLVEDFAGPVTWIECGPGRGAIASMVKNALSSQSDRRDAFINGINPGGRDGASPDAEAVSFASAIGAAWCAGHNLPVAFALGTGKHVSLPSTPYVRKRVWMLDQLVDSRQQRGDITPQPSADINLASQTISRASDAALSNKVIAPTKGGADVVSQLCDLLSDLSGEDINVAQSENQFLDLGCDSLLLTQVASAVRKEFDVDVSFRQLNEEFVTPQQLADYLELSGAAASDAGSVDEGNTNLPPISVISSLSQNNSHAGSTILDTLKQQLEGMQQQIAALEKAGNFAFFDKINANPADQKTSQIVSAKRKSGNGDATIKAHGPQLVVRTESGSQLTDRQESHIDKLIEHYIQRTPKSKEFTQTHRSALADPRTVSGFSPRLKEITYPLIIESSSGCHLRDIDGNDYVDLVSGFGSNFFGFGAPFVRQAVSRQMQRSMEIGPQSALVGEASSLFRKLVDCDRVAFCNTGSEAVLAALRLSRTVTGRDLVVVFSGGYHGIFDEVVARPTPRGSRPAAPGIPQGSVDNILVLPWADADSIDEIKRRGNEIAAVLVEPVQSRNPAVQPVDFLKQLRSVTEEIDAALIFDEVVCGFRVAPGGAQERFGITADLGTYGKVVGGGMPIGIVAGKEKYMDALDGGHWRFGDDSNPTVGVTYFAGTFVRHPPALAAAISCMEFMLEQGPDLQKRVDAISTTLVTKLTNLFERTGAPLQVDQFSSVIKLGYTNSVPNGEILFHHLRKRGVHILDSRPLFLTMTHTDEDIALIVDAVDNVISDMQSGGFFPEPSRQADPKNPPVPGAKLGRNPAGDPTWYVVDSDSPSGFRAV